VGGVGAISVVSNIVPGMMAAMCDAFFAGDLAKAKDLHYRMAPLCRGMFLETNPVPAKTALTWMGKIGFETRLPMVPLLPANQDKLRAILSEAGLV